MNKFKFWKRPKNANNQTKDGNTQPQRIAVSIDIYRFFLITRHDLLAEMLREVQSLNELPAEMWCRHMYKILESNVQEYNKQLTIYDQSREEEGGSPTE